MKRSSKNATSEAETLNQTLEDREQELEALKEHAKEQADAMRKKMEALQQVNRRQALKQAPDERRRVERL